MGAILVDGEERRQGRRGMAEGQPDALDAWLAGVTTLRRRATGLAAVKKASRRRPDARRDRGGSQLQGGLRPASCRPPPAAGARCRGRRIAHGRLAHRAQVPLGSWIEGCRRHASTTTPQASSTSSPSALGCGDRRLTATLLAVPPLVLIALFAAARLAGCTARGSSRVFVVARLPADHQSRLLAGDDRDALPGRLRRPSSASSSACRSASRRRTGRGSTPCCGRCST